MKRRVSWFSSWINYDPLDDPTTVGGKFANKKADTKPARFFQSWGSYPRWFSWLILGSIIVGTLISLTMFVLSFGPMP